MTVGFFFNSINYTLETFFYDFLGFISHVSICLEGFKKIYDIIDKIKELEVFKLLKKSIKNPKSIISIFF